jgi:hypothetical protein
MTSFREMESSGLLGERFGGASFQGSSEASWACSFANMVTAGRHRLAGRYAFAGLNAALLALGAKVVLAGEGERDFAVFPSRVRDRALPLGEDPASPEGGRRLQLARDN